MEDDVLKLLPFLNIIKHNSIELVGIIQNADEKIISFYDFNSIKTPELKNYFLKLGEEWWNESNRILPINIYIGKEMGIYRSCLKTYNTKEVEVVHGQITSLNTLLKKRIKKRQISLVKSM